MKKIAYGEGEKKVKKKTNNSAFSATHPYIKLTLVSFFTFFLCTFPLTKKIYFSHLRTQTLGFLAYERPIKTNCIG